MDYQPCVASGNKKTARAEAAMACLQVLATPPGDQTVPPQPHGVSPAVVAGGAPRAAPCPSTQLPKPVRPLMSFQPRPQFASLPLHRPPVSTVLHELPPPAVDTSDFTSDMFDDFRAFESRPVQPSDNQPLEAGESFAADENTSTEDQHQMLGVGAEAGEPQLEERSRKTSGALGLLGDAPQELADGCSKHRDDASYHVTSTGYSEFVDGFQPSEHQHIRDMPGIYGKNPDNIHPEFDDRPNTMFGGPRSLERQRIRDMPGIYGENPDNVHPEFDDGPNTMFGRTRSLEHQRIRNMPGIHGENPDNVHPEFSDRPNAMFGRPGERFCPEFEDFAEDSFTADRPGILGRYCEDTDEQCDDSYKPAEEFGHWEEDFEPGVCFQNPVRFRPRGIQHPHQQPFHVRGPRTPLTRLPPPQIPQRFPPVPRQRFPHPFDGPVQPPRCSAPLPRGLFRPRMRRFI